jgi:hypothetical protein
MAPVPRRPDVLPGARVSPAGTNADRGRGRGSDLHHLAHPPGPMAITSHLEQSRAAHGGDYMPLLATLVAKGAREPGTAGSGVV